MWIVAALGLLALVYYGKARRMNYKEIITHYFNSVNHWTNVYDVPKTVVLAIIKKESDGNFLALGTTGDYGLMQITQPALTDFNADTGKKYTLEYIRHTPDANIEVGSKHFGKALHAFDGDVFNALRAYNVGVAAAKSNDMAGYQYAKDVLSHKQSFEKELLA